MGNSVFLKVELKTWKPELQIQSPTFQWKSSRQETICYRDRNNYTAPQIIRGSTDTPPHPQSPQLLEQMSWSLYTPDTLRREGTPPLGHGPQRSISCRIFKKKLLWSTHHNFMRCLQNDIIFAECPALPFSIRTWRSESTNPVYAVFSYMQTKHGEPNRESKADWEDLKEDVLRRTLRIHWENQWQTRK